MMIALGMSQVSKCKDRVKVDLIGRNCTRSNAARGMWEQLDGVALSPLNRRVVSGKLVFGKRH